jgi:hypothetical protein
MTTLELKTNFHQLIDDISNEAMLVKFYEIMSIANVSNEGSLLKNLSMDEQQELIEIEKDSHIIENLIDHSSMELKFKKWL